MEDVETENGHSLPPVAGLRSDEKVRSSGGRTKRNLVIFSIVLVIAVMGITIGAVVGSKNKNKNNNAAESNASDNNRYQGGASGPRSTPAPESEVLKLLRTIALKLGEEFDDPTSYQSLALGWMQKNQIPDISEKRMTQRYVLACIFFSTFQIRTGYTDRDYGEEIVPEWSISGGWMLADDECTWFGITCNPATNDVTRFEMGNNQMTGRFPAEIQLLSSSLEYLDIGSNTLDNKEGELTWIGEMTNLRTLMFGYTYFEWPGIPSFLGKLVLLEKLDASFTLLHGPINGPAFENLVNLKYLEMGGNAYNSTIPSEIYALPLLERFYIQNSYVGGNLEFIKSMPRIIELWLDDNPGLVGTIPTEIGNLKNLLSISFSGNNFYGTIPSEIGQLTGLQAIWLYNNNELSGTIPTELGNLVNLVNFQTQGTKLSGKMPAEICLDKKNFNGNLEFLSTDCTGSGGNVECDCCDCCANPCAYDLEAGGEE